MERSFEMEGESEFSDRKRMLHSLMDTGSSTLLEICYQKKSGELSMDVHFFLKLCLNCFVWQKKLQAEYFFQVFCMLVLTSAVHFGLVRPAHCVLDV